jgi:membrane protease subunit (stomatin/prohibitin family)
MGLFNKENSDDKDKGLISRLKYDGGPDELVWKFPSEKLTIGAQLIVNQSQEAVFVKGGAVADVFGPGTHTLSANNIPILQKLVNLPFGGNTPFTAEVWYVNKTVRRNLPFGTATPIDLLDPLYDVSVPVRAFGNYGVQVIDSSALLREMVGTQHLFTTEEIIDQFRGLVVQKLTASISKFVILKEVTVVKINAYIDDIAKYVRDAINEEFAQYGVRIVNFDIMSLNFDKEDANVKKMLDSQSEKAKRQMEGYTYQQERQLDVMQTAAGNEGSAGQMMGAGMGLGMGFGVGGAFGQQMGNMAGVMQQPGMQQPGMQGPPPVMPPAPAPASMYHVMLNNTQYQMDAATMRQYVPGGQITRDTLVWKAGMAQWAKAGDCPELQPLFGVAPPPPPMPMPGAMPPPPPPMP